MSGTSLDGLDMALCTFDLNEENDNSWSYKIIESECIGYDEYWQIQLKEAHLLSGYHLIQLDKDYGKFIGQQVNAFIKKYNLHPELISSHGHTIFHEPDKDLTFQLGDGAAIFAE